VNNEYTYDAFLSHSAKDKAVARDVAARLQQDGVRVWLDEEQLPSPAGAGAGGRRPGEGRGEKPDSIPAKIEAGLEHSRVLVLCMSANAFGSDWAQLEAGTFRFRDPLNQERRFIPLRLDDAPHQRLAGAISLHQLAPGGARAGVWEILAACSRPAASNENRGVRCPSRDVAERLRP